MSPVTWSLNKIVNLFLSYYQHPAYAELWEKLEGKVFGFGIHHVGYFKIKVNKGVPQYIPCSHEAFELEKKQFDFFLEGPLKSYLAWLKQYHFPEAKQAGLNVGGDISLLMGLSIYFTHPPIDWSDRLSPYLGEGLSYRLSEGLEIMKTQLKETLTQCSQTTVDYWQNETLYLPTQASLDIFIEDFEDFREALERFEYHLILLEKQVC